MSARQWKPGQIALLDIGTGGDGIVALRTSYDGGEFVERGLWQGGPQGQVFEDAVVSARPLVVIDLGPGMAPVEAALRYLRRAAECNAADREEQTFFLWFAEQIADQSRPPKPDEPTGFAAVVEDVSGRRWTRDGMEEDGGPWFFASPPRGSDWERRTYDQIDVARVLTRGVPA